MKGEILRLYKIAVALSVILIAMLLGIIIAMSSALVSATPKEHHSNCDTGYSTQIEDGVEKITYIPANDTCKNK